jgi:hypothetical protein
VCGGSGGAVVGGTVCGRPAGGRQSRPAKLGQGCMGNAAGRLLSGSVSPACTQQVSLSPHQITAGCSAGACREMHVQSKEEWAAHGRLLPDLVVARRGPCRRGLHWFPLCLGGDHGCGLIRRKGRQG